MYKSTFVHFHLEPGPLLVKNLWETRDNIPVSILIAGVTAPTKAEVFINVVHCPI